MAQPVRQVFDEKSYSGTGPANYQRYFVPAIGAPVAAVLIDAAAIKDGERVLDVACGTGVLARLAAERAGPAATVVGVDVNPGMLAVARRVGPDSIEWREASAEAMPLSDLTFDVVLCGMGLQFMGNRAAALAEMRRVLAHGGRVAISLPGPIQPMFAVFSELLAKHIHPDAARFALAVFSLHEADEIRNLLGEAGFKDARVQTTEMTLNLPAPADFLWQYVHSTPLAGVLAKASDDRKAALDRDIREQWRPFVRGDGMEIELTTNTVTAIR
jgi:ubiquinone/menaquinone biosynthesis C-methylase UbiE